MYWEISPNKDPDYDYACLPSDDGGSLDDAALEYIQERVFDAWDNAQPDGPTATITVRILNGDLPAECREEDI